MTKPKLLSDREIEKWLLDWSATYGVFSLSGVTVDELLDLINTQKRLYAESVQKAMADNLINQERKLYKIFDDDLQICVGIKKMADQVREYYDGGIYQYNYRTESEAK